MPKLLYTGEEVTWMKEDGDGNITEWSETEYDAWETQAQNSSQIDDTRSQALDTINEHAGETRKKYITILPGQEMIYQEKAEEAADYVAAGYPEDISNYPFIGSEANATKKTPKKVADEILKQKSQWIAKSAKIEKYRMRGKLKASRARSAEKINEIVAKTIELLDKV